jgi:hypothetical protein
MYRKSKKGLKIIEMISCFGLVEAEGLKRVALSGLARWTAKRPGPYTNRVQEKPEAAAFCRDCNSATAPSLVVYFNQHATP